MSTITSEIQTKSYTILRFWKNDAYGWAPDNICEKLEVARLDWLEDLTNTLLIWEEKNFLLTDGELILAYANLGALVEGWLKFFYCIYREDYSRDVKEKHRNKNFMDIEKEEIVEPNNLKFEFLKQFSVNTLWHKNDKQKWVDKIQKRRNTIHAFNNADIGNAIEFIEDLKEFSIFIDEINSRLEYPNL